MFMKANAFITIFNHAGHKHVLPILAYSPEPPPPFKQAILNNLQHPISRSDKQFTGSKTFEKTLQLCSPRAPSQVYCSVFNMRWYGSSICLSVPEPRLVFSSKNWEQVVSTTFSFLCSEVNVSYSKLDALSSPFEGPLSVVPRKFDKYSIISDHVDSLRLELGALWATFEEVVDVWNGSCLLARVDSFLVKGTRTRNSPRSMG